MERQIFAGAAHESRAVYLYAGQPKNHVIGQRPLIRQGPLPSWLPTSDLFDFLDPGCPFFTTNRALFSCGPLLHRAGGMAPGMFTPRPAVTILGDSGGFQFIGNPSLWQGNATRRWVLDWQEANTDEAITLDIPTRAIVPNSPWPTFADALACTEASLRFFAANGTGTTRHLNALQGRDRKEARQWYEAIKWFPGGGWAFGGTMRADFAHVVDMLVRMAREGLLGRDRNRIHVLGMADLKSAVALSAIQRGMRERLEDDGFLITFDVSSPSVMIANGLAFGFPSLSPSAFGMTYWRPPSVVDPKHAGDRWPILSSSIGSLMTRGDICVAKPGSLAQTAWDEVSETMLILHNVHSLLAGIDMANSVLELPAADAAALAPDYVVNSYHALRDACRKADPWSYLRQYRGDLSRM